jgi:hypothetical protein
MRREAKGLVSSAQKQFVTFEGSAMSEVSRFFRPVVGPVDTRGLWGILWGLWFKMVGNNE